MHARKQIDISDNSAVYESSRILLLELKIALISSLTYDGGVCLTISLHGKTCAFNKTSRKDKHETASSVEYNRHDRFVEFEP